MSERCRATRHDGQPCLVTWGLAPETRLCLAHDPLRKELAAAARRAGGITTTGAVAAPPRDGAKYRVVPPHAVPRGRPPKTLDDCIRWASWLAFAAVTGLIDGISIREANRSLQTLKDSIHKKDLLDRIRRLEKLVSQY